MALQPSVFILGAQLSFNYNAGNGRATSVDISTPVPIHFRIALSNGSTIAQTIQPGNSSFPLPANLVRISTDAQGEVTYTGLVSIEANG